MSVISQTQFPDTLERFALDGVGGVRSSADRAFETGTTCQYDTDADASTRLGSTLASEALSFSVVRDMAGFEALEQEWNSLFERAGKPHQVFQTFNWCWHWCSQFLGSGHGGDVETSSSQSTQISELYILAGRIDGRLVMVWPMVRRSVLGVARLSWLGAPVSQYGDVILDEISEPRVALEAAWDYLLDNAKVDLIQLWKVREDSSVAGILADKGGVVTDTKIAPYLSLGNSGTVDEFLKSKPRAKNRRRIRRGLQASGGVEFKVFEPGSLARDIAKTALDWKRAWLEDKGLFSRALNDKRTDAFFVGVTSGEHRCVKARVSALCVGDRLVAVEIGFPCKGALAMHVIVYDHTFNKSGCGALAMEDSIRACWADGFKTFDLLAPGDKYKLDWADNSIRVDDWSVAVNMKGRVWGWLEDNVVKNGAKRALGLFPVSIRQFLTRVMATVAGSRN